MGAEQSTVVEPQLIRGLQGVPGPRGMDGKNGTQGVQGEMGPRGFDGPRGPQGIQGGIGPKGDKSDPGIQGGIGPQGIQGEIGPAGSQGQQGIPGQIGPQGLQGGIGLTGSQGIQGIQGGIGPKGSDGKGLDTTKFDAFSRTNVFRYSEGWSRDDNNGAWDNIIRGPNQVGLAHTDAIHDGDANNRWAVVDVPANMKTGYLVHLNWDNTRYFDIFGVRHNNAETFLNRIEAFQPQVSWHDGQHSGVVTISITRVDRFKSIKIQGRKGRIHLMGMGWNEQFASGQFSTGYVNFDNVIGQVPTSRLSGNINTDRLDGNISGDRIKGGNINGDISGARGRFNTSIQLAQNGEFSDHPWRNGGLHIRNGNGTWTHFNPNNESINYIRGDTIIDNGRLRTNQWCDVNGNGCVNLGELQRLVRVVQGDVGGDVLIKHGNTQTNFGGNQTVYFPTNVNVPQAIEQQEWRIMRMGNGNLHIGHGDANNWNLALTPSGRTVNTRGQPVVHGER